MSDINAKVARNSAYGVTGQIVLKVLSFAFMTFIVRHLGHDDFGKYSFVIAFVGIFSIFSDFGIAPYLVREIARDRSKASSLFWNAVVVRLILSCAVFIATSIAARLLRYPADMTLAIAIASAGLFLYAFQGLLDAILVANERLGYSSAFSVLNQFVFVVGGSLVLIAGGSFVVLLIVSLVGICVAGVSAGIVAFRQLGLHSAPLSPKSWLPLLKRSIPFALLGFSLLVSYKVDSVILFMARGESEVGWYTAAYNLIFTLMFVSHSINLALFPSLSRQYSLDTGSVQATCQKTAKYLLLFALPVAFGTTIVANKIVLLLYTSEFAPAIGALQILVWVLPLMFMDELLGYIAVAIGRERSAATAAAVAAVFNLTANLLFIPRFGLLGAAAITVATEVVFLFQYCVMLRDEPIVRGLFGAVGKPFVVSGIMGVCVLLVNGLDFTVVILLAVTVYAGLLLLSRTISPSEVKALYDAFTQRKTGEQRVEDNAMSRIANRNRA